LSRFGGGVNLGVVEIDGVKTDGVAFSINRFDGSVKWNSVVFGLSTKLPKGVFPTIGP
jgi:hypothetical protein